MEIVLTFKENLWQIYMSFFLYAVQRCRTDGIPGHVISVNVFIIELLHRSKDIGQEHGA